MCQRNTWIKISLQYAKCYCAMPDANKERTIGDDVVTKFDKLRQSGVKHKSMCCIFQIYLFFVVSAIAIYLFCLRQSPQGTFAYKCVCV